MPLALAYGYYAYAAQHREDITTRASCYLYGADMLDARFDCWLVSWLVGSVVAPIWHKLCHLFRQMNGLTFELNSNELGKRSGKDNKYLELTSDTGRIEVLYTWVTRSLVRSFDNVLRILRFQTEWCYHCFICSAISLDSEPWKFLWDITVRFSHLNTSIIFL